MTGCLSLAVALCHDDKLVEGFAPDGRLRTWSKDLRLVGFNLPAPNQRPTYVGILALLCLVKIIKLVFQFHRSHLARITFAQICLANMERGMGIVPAPSRTWVSSTPSAFATIIPFHNEQFSSQRTSHALRSRPPNSTLQLFQSLGPKTQSEETRLRLFSSNPSCQQGRTTRQPNITWSSNPSCQQG